MKGYVVGIDLGTSFSSIAWLDEQKQVRVLEDEEGDRLMPSAIFVAADRSILVGKQALTAGRAAPKRLLVETKRLLGNPSTIWTLDAVEYTPVDLSAFLLRELKITFERKVGLIDRAVISVPAYFRSHQRELTLQAAAEAGYQDCDLISEPVAAALSYILGGEDLAYLELAGDQIILVYDLGGGTFDLSLVRYGSRNLRVMAVGGDLQLGGIDWTRRLAENVRTRFEAERGLDLKRDEIAWRKLYELVERSKCLLSDPAKEEATFKIDSSRGSEEIRLTRDGFEALTADLVERTRVLTEQLMKRAQLRWPQINQILVVGGGTRMPMIRAMLQKAWFTPHGTKATPKVSPDLAVVQGATLFASVSASRRPTHPQTDATVGDDPTSVIDVKNVTAHSLGVIVYREGQGRVNRILLPRDTPLPASASLVVGTVDENQHRITVIVVESEAEEYVEAATVCRCVLDNLPPGLPKMSLFDLTLNYEANGTLQVVAQHRDSGLLAAVSVQRPTGGPSRGGTDAPAAG